MEKTKRVFNKKGKEKKEIWKWEGKELEEVTNFKYLDFIFNRKGNCRDHIKELERRERITVNKV